MRSSSLRSNSGDRRLARFIADPPGFADADNKSAVPNSVLDISLDRFHNACNFSRHSDAPPRHLPEPQSRQDQRGKRPIERFRNDFPGNTGIRPIFRLFSRPEALMGQTVLSLYHRRTIDILFLYNNCL